MPTIEIPLTTYLVRSKKPNKIYGVPTAEPVIDGEAYLLARVPLDRVPVDTTITAVTLRVFSDRASVGSKNVSVRPITSPWSSRVTWNTMPSVGSVIDSVDIVNPAAGQQWDLDITSYAATRDRKGVRIGSGSNPGHFLRSSSGATNKPVLVVTYYVASLGATGGWAPSGLQPDGGTVSVAQPILVYAGSEDMTAQKIEFGNDGVNPNVYTSAWLPATEGRYVPADDGGGPPSLTNHGAGIYWRATTRGPGGDSDPSEWAYYEYDSLPVLTITNPPDPTDDGTPTLQWTFGGGGTQESWAAWLYSGSTLIAKSGWRNEAATRDWTPPRGVQVPDGVGVFYLQATDAGQVRVAAENAPAYAQVSKTFNTIANVGGVAIDTIGYRYEEPVPIITGTRVAGIPDSVSLWRDGVQVPLWDDAGTYYQGFAPAVDFFSGDDFAIPDYTADPRHSHTWSVKAIVNGVQAGGGPTVTEKPVTRSVWLVDPSTGDRVEVLGYGEVPVVDQTTEENSIVHTPVNDGLIVEPKRRRLVRSTRFGAITGVVLDSHEDILASWVEGDSATHYRLVFGKVNWPVILGDSSPSDVFYPDNCGPDRVLVSVNWWQRLADD